ncbi:MAG: TlpA disulfide reductase family protein [Pirellulaceae bacterium]
MLVGFHAQFLKKHPAQIAMLRFHTKYLAISLAVFVLATYANAQEPAPPAEPPSQPPAAEIPPLPDLTIPPGASPQQLSELITKIKAVTPRSPEQYKTMQTALRDASRQVLNLLKGKEGTPAYQQAEMDTIAASVALMTYFNEKQQAEVIKQVHDFLTGREKLSMQDVQTGMLAAAMLELQPNKKPSRDTYELLDKLLEDDEREEMQSLRINLQAAVRRLDLLGEKFEFEAVDMAGKKLKTDDFAGKFVVVDFFATWCEPCLSEMPRLKKHYAKYKDKGLEVIGISLDGDSQALEKFLDGAQLPWPIVHDNAENPLDRIQMQFGVSSLPTVLLLNKEGTVVSLEARGAELDRLVDMLFEKPTPAPPPK